MICLPFSVLKHQDTLLSALKKRMTTYAVIMDPRQKVNTCSQTINLLSLRLETQGIDLSTSQRLSPCPPLLHTCVMVNLFLKWVIHVQQIF